MGAQLIDAGQSWLSRVWQLNIFCARNRSGSVLGDLGVAHIGFSVGSPAAAEVVRRAWSNDLLYIFLLWCRGELMGLFVCNNRNALGICICNVCVIDNNFRQTARFSYVYLISWLCG